MYAPLSETPRKGCHDVVPFGGGIGFRRLTLDIVFLVKYFLVCILLAICEVITAEQTHLVVGIGVLGVPRATVEAVRHREVSHDLNGLPKGG